MLCLQAPAAAEKSRAGPGKGQRCPGPAAPASSSAHPCAASTSSSLSPSLSVPSCPGAVPPLQPRSLSSIQQPQRQSQKNPRGRQPAPFASFQPARSPARSVRGGGGQRGRSLPAPGAADISHLQGASQVVTIAG
ncbi:translation initiation factor IF-2-like isoform X2 [Cuculus canorus]|uniref:translation initiation factor IF-2-like isoform X2 n=1 Tax=Cuculus canorus TaxID=55661 RepID=UPI0023AA4364|nr:translation initiation factor IF-2-like isoform X2 [Cuculus canorus]